MECLGGALTQAVAEALDLEEGSRFLPGGLLPGTPAGQADVRPWT